MMAKSGDVSLTVSVAAPPDAIWSLLRHFHDVASWSPFLAHSRLLSGAKDEIGAQREVVAHDGTIVHEQLIEIDDVQRALGYKLLTPSAQVVGQRNRIMVAPGEDKGLSLVTFSAHFQPVDGALVKDVVDVNGSAFIATANGLGRLLGVDVHVVAVDL